MENPAEKYVAVEGINIRYIVSGSGTPTLLLHGFGEFLEVWWFNIGALSQHFQVYAMDLPGHGLSDKPKIDYGLAFANECATGFMRALGIERANLIGHSMGGVVALSIAINFPEKVDKLILVDSGGLSGETPLLYRLCTLPLLGEILVEPTIKVGLRHGIERAFYNPDLITEEMVDKNYEFMRMRGAKKAMLSILRSNADITGPHPEVVMTDKLHLVKSPTLFIHGAQDEVVPVEQAKNASRLVPNARLEVVKKCGHCPHIEKAQEFNKTAIAFLKSDEPKGG